MPEGRDYARNFGRGGSGAGGGARAGARILRGEQVRDRKQEVSTALEIEQPFGDAPSDLPIEEYTLALEKEMLEMIAEYDKKAEEAKEMGTSK